MMSMMVDEKPPYRDPDPVEDTNVAVMEDPLVVDKPDDQHDGQATGAEVTTPIGQVSVYRTSEKCKSGTAAVYSWAVDRKTRNRATHAKNGNTTTAMYCRECLEWEDLCECGGTLICFDRAMAPKTASRKALGLTTQGAVEKALKAKVPCGNFVGCVDYGDGEIDVLCKDVQAFTALDLFGFGDGQMWTCWGMNEEIPASDALVVEVTGFIDTVDFLKKFLKTKLKTIHNKEPGAYILVIFDGIQPKIDYTTHTRELFQDSKYSDLTNKMQFVWVDKLVEWPLAVAEDITEEEKAQLRKQMEDIRARAEDAERRAVEAERRVAELETKLAERTRQVEVLQGDVDVERAQAEEYKKAYASKEHEAARARENEAKERRRRTRAEARSRQPQQAATQAVVEEDEVVVDLQEIDELVDMWVVAHREGNSGEGKEYENLLRPFATTFGLSVESPDVAEWMLELKRLCTK